MDREFLVEYLESVLYPYSDPFKPPVGAMRGIRIRKLGERGSGTKLKGPVQDFHKIRKNCLAAGKLFEDPEFPANNTSLFPDRNTHIVWKRPKEICNNPQLYVEGVSRFDLNQGQLGNCWFVAAVANLTLHKHLVDQVIPSDQSFVENYAGIFHFRFWQFGKWVDVVVDDYLPTQNNKLMFLHSAEKNEFWSALLEKAYAKLHGSYQALIGGNSCDAMEDFTGGLSEVIRLDKEKDSNKVFNIMKKAYERSSLMGCSIDVSTKGYCLEEATPEGLITGHAYSVTKVSYVESNFGQSKHQLIRIRNPWGNEAEWNGPWSDKSKEWNKISKYEREKIGLTFEQDGEFWMTAKDFMHYFTILEICNLGPELNDSLNGKEKRWEKSSFDGQWTCGITAGGCINNRYSFWQNPQYIITVDEPDDGSGETECTVIVALLQKTKHLKGRRSAGLLSIGFAIYHLKNPEELPKPLGMDFFSYNRSSAVSEFINLREVTGRFKLSPGTYCIIPSTFSPNHEGEFILRVFSEKRNNMKEHDKEVGMEESYSKGKENELEANNNDREAQRLFKSICGEDMVVDWMELKKILDSAFSIGINGEGFSKDVCRSMVAMMDEDKTGTLDLQEFQHLWIDIRNWKNVFKQYDKDLSGNLDVNELRAALTSAGYNLNKRILSMLVHRYAGRKGKISLDDFMLCAVRLKGMIETFKEKKKYYGNSASFTLEEWLETTVYS